MSQVRKNLSLSAEAADCLANVGDGNASEYVSRLVVERERLWRDALGLIRAIGWRRQHVLACIEVLSGYHLGSMASRTAGAIALELRDAEAVPSKWGVADDWRNIMQLVADRSELSLAVLVLTEEHWAGNTECVRRINGLRGVGE